MMASLNFLSTSKKNSMANKATMPILRVRLAKNTKKPSVNQDRDFSLKENSLVFEYFKYALMNSRIIRDCRNINIASLYVWLAKYRMVELTDKISSTSEVKVGETCFRKV